MKINLAGGWIDVSAESWVNTATGEALPYWIAHSDWTNETEVFLTKGMAEFKVWVINERYESLRAREGLQDVRIEPTPLKPA